MCVPRPAPAYSPQVGCTGTFYIGPWKVQKKTSFKPYIHDLNYRKDEFIQYGGAASPKWGKSRTCL